MKKLCAFLMAAVALFYSVGLQAQDKGYKPGDTVLDFQLKNLDGRMVSLSSIPDAKGYIVIFTCNHCPYAKAYEDRIIQLHLRFAPLGYPVVAINPNDAKVSPEDSYPKMKERAKLRGFPFEYLYDEKQTVAKQFGAAKTPHVYLLRNKDGQNIVEYIGAIDNDWENPAQASRHYVEEAILNFSTDMPLVDRETKAVGCTIKWAKQ